MEAKLRHPWKQNCGTHGSEIEAPMEPKLRRPLKFHIFNGTITTEIEV